MIGHEPRQKWPTRSPRHCGRPTTSITTWHPCFSEQAGQFGTGNETTVAAAATDGVKDPGLTLLEPPKDGTPSQNAGWWNSLSPAGQAILLHDHPDWLGNLDGLPASVRSQANIERLPQMKADLQHQLDEANKQAEGPAIGEYDLQLGVDKINAIQAKLDSINSIQTTLAQGDRQLLFLDNSQPRLEAAVAVGNVDTAQNVAVFTSGLTSTVNGDLKTYDGDMNNMKLVSQRLDLKYGGGPTAAVTWIGYQAPQLDGGLADPAQSVASPDAAKTGGESLAKFYNGIGASHALSDAPLHLTALGHSYGSVTTGFALGHDTPVNDAVLFGSPGQGAQHLSVPAGHLFSEKSSADVVPYINGTLGPSPYFAANPSPVYQPLSTSASTTGLGQFNANYGHTTYLDNNSTSLYNMAAVTSGHSDLAVR
jgi:Alpha/beta hydrolase